MAQYWKELGPVKWHAQQWGQKWFGLDFERVITLRSRAEIDGIPHHLVTYMLYLGPVVVSWSKWRKDPQ